MDFHSLTRKELQALCKKNKIPANMTNVAMADALAVLATVDGLEEHLVQTESEAHFSPERPAANTPRISRTSVRRKTVKDESESTKLTTKSRRGTKESISSESMQGKNALPDTGAAAITARSSTRRAVTEEVKKELLQTPAVASSQRKAAARSMRGKVQNVQVKEEGKTEVKIYTTRRSTRLVEKKMEDLSLKDGEENTGESSRGKAVEADLENAFDEKSDVLTGVEENNEISGESKVTFKEVPMESEISPVVLGKEVKDLAANEGDPQDIVSENKVQGHDHQGCDSYADDFQAHIEASSSTLGEPNLNVEVTEFDSEMKCEGNTIHTTFEATNKGFDESKDVFMDVIPSEVDNDTKQSGHKDKGTPAEIDVPASLIFNSQSLDGELNLKKPQDDDDDTNGLAVSWSSLEAKATTVVHDEYCGTEASDISSIHDFDELNDDILREVKKLNDADFKAECGLTNMNAAPTSSGTPAGFVNAGGSSFDDNNEDETKLIDSKVLSQTTHGDASLYEEHTKKIEVSELVDALDAHNGGKVLAEDEGTCIAEIAFQMKAPECSEDGCSSASEENTHQVVFKNEEEKIDQADAYESVDDANLYAVDMFVDIELVSEEILCDPVNVETSDLVNVQTSNLGRFFPPDRTDNPVAIESSAEAKEASHMKIVSASCEVYPISESSAETKEASHMEVVSASCEVYPISESSAETKEASHMEVVSASCEVYAISESSAETKEASHMEVVSASSEVYPLSETSAEAKEVSPMEAVPASCGGYYPLSEASAEAKEASPMEAVPTSCKGYPLSENSGFDQKTTSQFRSTDENVKVANQKELDCQFARLLLKSTPSNKSSSAQRITSSEKQSSAQRMICVVDDKENNVSNANKPVLRAQKILVAKSGTPLENKSINCLRKMLKEKLQKEEKIRPALQSISGNCAAIGECHSRDLSS